MKKLLASAAFSLALGALAVGQQPQPTFHDELLDHFQGSWVLQGTIAGKETTHDITNDWVLNHQYFRIHEVSREKNAQGNPAYEAIWLDIWGGFGKATVGYAPRSGDEIRFLFNDGKSDFHTTFLYDRKADTWEWRMDNEENGKLKPFARVKLTRRN